MKFYQRKQFVPANLLIKRNNVKSVQFWFTHPSNTLDFKLTEIKSCSSASLSWRHNDLTANMTSRGQASRPG